MILFRNKILNLNKQITTVPRMKFKKFYIFFETFLHLLENLIQIELFLTIYLYYNIEKKLNNVESGHPFSKII